MALFGVSLMTGVTARVLLVVVEGVVEEVPVVLEGGSSSSTKSYSSPAGVAVAVEKELEGPATAFAAADELSFEDDDDDDFFESPPLFFTFFSDLDDLSPPPPPSLRLEPSLAASAAAANASSSVFNLMT